MAPRLGKVGTGAPEAIVVAAAAALVWAFAATVLVHTRAMGLPLDDSYIYLTYAKQFGRGQPFTYYPGGGYSAGSTSVLWPMLLAPFWALGARGHALVWVSYGLSGALFAGVGLGVARVVRRIGGCAPVGTAAGVMALYIAPFAFCALSGMEVALASALIVAALVLLLDAPRDAPPSWPLVAVLAGTSLSRPEAMLIAAGICGAAAVATLRRTRERRAAARWLVPLAAPLAWLIANELFAGHLFPNTGVVKSHFYLPGFDWTYWRKAVLVEAGAMLKALFWASDSPLLYPRLVVVAMLVGSARVILWARRERRPLVAAVAIGAPLALMLAVVATSGMSGYSFQNFRYIAPAFPLLFVLVGIALAPPARVAAVRRGKPAWAALACALAAVFVTVAWTPLRAAMLQFAQDASDANAQVVAIGEYVHDKLPGARVMFHDAGAIAYYGDGAVYDMLGLVTNDQADIANNGPGSRFEFLERLAPDARPTHFAYYPSWLGVPDFFGEPILQAPVAPSFAKGRLAGGRDMELMPAVWDHVHTAEVPLAEHAGWRVVDRIDVADVASERAHGWTATLGRRHFGDPTARWSFVGRDVGPLGLAIDGGRTIRTEPLGVASESFDIELDPELPTRLVLRTGGEPLVPFQDRVGRAILTVAVDGRPAGQLELASPADHFDEVVLELPARGPGASRTVHIRTEASAPYRAFHWFALQPS